MENYNFPVYILVGITTKIIRYLENNLLYAFSSKTCTQVKFKLFIIIESIPDQLNEIHRIICTWAFLYKQRKNVLMKLKIKTYST